MKIGLAILLGLLVLLLSACGDDKDDNNTTVVRTVEQSTTTTETDNTNNNTETTAETDNADLEQGGNDLSNRRFFSTDSPWNIRTDALNIDVKSDELISNAKQRVGVIEGDGDLPPSLIRRTINDGIFVNTMQWTVPIVSGGPETKVICRQKICGDNENINTLPIPNDINPDPRYDGWFTVIRGNIAYDMWRARREKDRTISYHFMKQWDLNGKGFSPPNTVSARGSGLPLAAGVIRPSELRRGIVDHALAISVPGPAQRNYVQPASVTDGNGELLALPEGARIRLKANRRAQPPLDPRTNRPIKWTRQERRTADALTAALRTYGAIVIGRAAVPTLYAQKDAVNSLLSGNELQNLKLDDFEVMELGKVYKYPPTSTKQANTRESLTATPDTSKSGELNSETTQTTTTRETNE